MSEPRRKGIDRSITLGRGARVGDNVIKFAKSTLVCCKCYTQVEVSGFHKSELAIFKCVKDTCPAFGKTRNYAQTLYLEYEAQIEHRPLKVVQ